MGVFRPKSIFSAHIGSDGCISSQIDPSGPDRCISDQIDPLGQFRVYFGLNWSFRPRSGLFQPKTILSAQIRSISAQIDSFGPVRFFFRSKSILSAEMGFDRSISAQFDSFGPVWVWSVYFGLNRSPRPRSGLMGLFRPKSTLSALNGVFRPKSIPSANIGPISA